MDNNGALRRELDSIWYGLQRTTSLALVTNRGQTRDQAKHEAIVHFRGDALEAAVSAFANHKAEKASYAYEQEKGDTSGGGEEGAAAGGSFMDQDRQRPAAAEPAAKRQRSPDRITAEADEGVFPWSCKLYQVVLEQLRKKADEAQEGRKFAYAVSAVERLFSLDARATVEASHWHTDEPEWEDQHNQVWRATLEFRGTDSGLTANEIFKFDVKPLLGGDLIIHRNNPQAGRLAREAAEAAGVPLPGKGKGQGRGTGAGAGGGKGQTWGKGKGGGGSGSGSSAGGSGGCGGGGFAATAKSKGKKKGKDKNGTWEKGKGGKDLGGWSGGSVGGYGIDWGYQGKGWY